METPDKRGECSAEVDRLWGLETRDAVCVVEVRQVDYHQAQVNSAQQKWQDHEHQERKMRGGA